MKKIQKSKIFMSFFAALLVTVSLVACMGLVGGNENTGNLVIVLPPLRRAITGNIADLRAATKRYSVTVEHSGQSQVKGGAQETFAFYVPNGSHMEITIDCLNPRGTTIVQTKKA